MADLLGAANRVPGYDSSKNNRSIPVPSRSGDPQIQNVADPTRVGRADARTDQQGSNDALQSDVPRYDSNLQTFLQRLQETPSLPELMQKSMMVMRSAISTPGLQQGIAQEMAQLLEMLNLDAEGFQRFFMEQVHGGNRFAGPLFSLLRQAYSALPGDHVRQSLLEFARRYSDFSSTEHIGRSMLSLLQQMKAYLPKSWQPQLEDMTARLENSLAAGSRSDALGLLQNEIIPYLGRYVERTHDFGTLRDLLNLLTLHVARYENGAEGPLLQSFRQTEGYSELLKGLNQLDDNAILKLLRENDFTRATAHFSDTFSAAAEKALQGTYGPDVRDAFAEIVRALLIQESVYMPINHMFFPLNWKGKMMYSELWVDPDADREAQNQADQNRVQFLFKLDLESLGFLEITLSARQDQVDMKVLGPQAVSSHEAVIAEDLREILSQHGLTGKDIRIAKLEKPLALTDVFPHLFEGRQGVDVKI